MSSNRLPYFPFDVSDYLNDPAVLGMSADTEGVYVRLLARMWQTSTPGIIDPDLIYELASVRRLAEQYRVLFRREEIHWDADVQPEELAQYRCEEVMEELAMAFDTESQPGLWIQRRMVTEWKRAMTLSAARANGGRITQKQRRSSAPSNVERNSNIQAGLKPTSSLAPGNREVEVEREKEKTEALRMRAEEKGDNRPVAIPEILPAGPSWTWDRPSSEPNGPAKSPLQALKPPEGICDTDSARDALAELEAQCAQADADEAAEKTGQNDDVWHH